VSTIFFVNRQF